MQIDSQHIFLYKYVDLLLDINEITILKLNKNLFKYFLHVIKVVCNFDSCKARNPKTLKHHKS